MILALYLGVGRLASSRKWRTTGEGDEEITADDIRQMKKADIIQLIEDNEIPIDPAEYPKVSELRNAVIALMESDDDEDGDEDGEEAGGDDGEDW